MKNCLLCKSHPADKTGSHIIPFFLLKRIDNEVGNPSRGRELGFRIGERDTTSYFGRSVSPEKLSELFGEISDEEIDQNKIPLIEDNYFCTDCEKRLANIENEYSSTLEVHEENSKITPEFGFLFWVSILWRISVFKNQGLILKTKEEELLRIILNEYLPLDINQFKFDDIRTDSSCLNLFYRLIRCPDYSLTSATYLFCHNFFKMPYTIIIDEYVLFFYFKKGHIDKLIQDTFGFEKNLKGKPINTVVNGEIKILFDKTEFKVCLEKVERLFVEKRFDYYRMLLDGIHKKLTATDNPMPQNLKDAVINRLVTTENRLGRKYTFDHFLKSTYDELIKFAH